MIKKSSMRVMAIMCVVTACIIGIIVACKGHDPERFAWLVSAFLFPAMAGKVFQKKFEVQNEILNGFKKPGIGD